MHGEREYAKRPDNFFLSLIQVSQPNVAATASTINNFETKVKHKENIKAKWNRTIQNSENDRSYTQGGMAREEAGPIRNQGCAV
jgi:hypothetical protein